MNNDLHSIIVLKPHQMITDEMLTALKKDVQELVYNMQLS